MGDSIKYPFKKAVLKDCGGDLSKRWYLEYYVWSEKREKLMRRRWYQGFDEFNDYDSRRKYGLKCARELNELLPTSCIDKLPRVEKKTERPVPRHELQVVQELEKILVQLYKPESITYKSYTGCVLRFSDWLKAQGRKNLTFAFFSKSMAQSYVDFLSNKEGLSGKTVKNRVSALKTLSNKLVEREIIETNPFIKLSMPKIIQTEKNASFSTDQINTIKKYCEKHDPFLWLVCQFIYYTYMRPVEIGRLKIKHFDMEHSKIHVTGDISKNGKNQTIEIPQDLRIKLLEYGLEKYPPNYYVFTALKTPGTARIAKSYFGKKFLEVRRRLKMDEKYTLYSWKHTGVVKAYQNGVDIKAIQQQCRHHSIDQTDTYLKSLGFSKNDEFLKGMPSI